jgi:hypothetical protein
MPAADDATCDGLDDDCDGAVDEDYMPMATTCGVGEDYMPMATTCGVGECAANGQTTCVDGSEGDTCTPGTPGAEVCDNVDNDCDGSTDEDLTRPTTCGVGECAGNTGEETCTAGTWGNDTCDPFAGAIPEGPPGQGTCSDMLDNDCDGFTDTGDSDCAVVTGGEGCSQGYWKKEKHFDAWHGYTPFTPFSDVFDDAFPEMTLQQVLRQRGGGLKALGRQAVAALLNAASPDVSYDLSENEVIMMFNRAYPGIKKEYNDLKENFEDFNEQGCPLNSRRIENENNHYKKSYTRKKGTEIVKDLHKKQMKKNKVNSRRIEDENNHYKESYTRKKGKEIVKDLHKKQMKKNQDERD